MRVFALFKTNDIRCLPEGWGEGQSFVMRKSLNCIQLSPCVTFRKIYVFMFDC